MLAEKISTASTAGYGQNSTAVRLLAHRGCWRQPAERNSLAALTTALSRNYGLETDVRDWNGKLVISHDPPTSAALPLETLFARYQQMGSQACLALNIKSDGLAAELSRLLKKFAIHHYFVFDMSVPDARSHLQNGLRVYARQSEIESQVPLYAACEGIWLDAFHDDWYTQDTLMEHIDNGKQVAVVSPELHGRSHEKIWQLIRDLPKAYARKTLLCTDYPEHFGESQ